ncbi:hypothetical protein G6O69_24055 [Pseudenhygromyxa sp. WMMC2535]|uniref:hypothetical protein n=1 Tax=Pseudenhygromyxa sp. WMMC2535 TaxID=2712867 RepID=UPI001554D065|nr:hypothetical protein [Pseudenhygromyxa sp. WMMC2535]NVB40935.1 hypothetical protein [Pseudenhygromyxa sp. WMMC2535]
MTIVLGALCVLTACDTGTSVETHFRSEGCFRQQQARIAAEWLEEVRAEFGSQAIQQLNTKQSRAQFINYAQAVAAQCPDCTRSNILAQLLGPVSELDNYPAVDKHYGQGFVSAAQHWINEGSGACETPPSVVAACESPFLGLGLAGYAIDSCESVNGGLPVADGDDDADDGANDGANDGADDGASTTGEGTSEGTLDGGDSVLPTETEESGVIDGGSEPSYPWPCNPPYEMCPTEFQVF